MQCLQLINTVLCTRIHSAKFNGTVFPVIPSQPIRMTNEEATTTMVSQRASLDTTLDIITYALIGLSGFLSLLLIVAICCTTLVWCVQCTKKKRRSELKPTKMRSMTFNSGQIDNNIIYPFICLRRCAWFSKLMIDLH